MIPARYQPQHDIGLAHRLIKAGKYIASKHNVLKNINYLNITQTQMEDILLGLTRDDYCKSEIDRNNEDWQDYFKPKRIIRGYRLFIKWKINENKSLLIITSVKEDTDNLS